MEDLLSSHSSTEAGQMHLRNSLQILDVLLGMAARDTHVYLSCWALRCGSSGMPCTVHHHAALAHIPHRFR